MVKDTLSFVFQSIIQSLCEIEVTLTANDTLTLNEQVIIKYLKFNTLVKISKGLSDVHLLELTHMTYQPCHMKKDLKLELNHGRLLLVPYLEA